MSIGNVTQAISFENSNLTLVIGDNLDLGGNGNRNGVGKTSIINAMCFAFYGNAITNIKKDNLVNRTNNKDMLVTVEFEKNGTKYRIERGRKPAVFKFIIDDIDVDGETDEGQGENKNTQKEIDRVLGMSYVMFKHLITLNTFTDPFLSLGAGAQRDIIEQLLGITLLSEKADKLKELIKKTKDDIREEEIKIKSQEDANQRIEKTIKDLMRRQTVWGNKKQQDLEELESALRELEIVDIDQEIASHEKLKQYHEQKRKISDANIEISKIQVAIDGDQKRIIKYQNELNKLNSHECYACGQKINDDSHQSLIADKTEAIRTLTDSISQAENRLHSLTYELEAAGELISEPSTYYQDVSAAYEHKSSIQQLESEIGRKKQETDPYQDQVKSLNETGLKKISWDNMNSLNRLKDHQEFLFKLLTNKDSFIRKKIIEQNISYLNNRLGYYLEKLGLPHQVLFQSDLTVEITELGRDMDFDNLSRGERNRLILGLSWSFRDVFESMNDPINFMAIDELMDNGMDGTGAEAALEVLKDMARSRNKSILLISHKEELVSRVSNILTVVKENGFTGFQFEDTDSERSLT